MRIVVPLATTWLVACTGMSADSLPEDKERPPQEPPPEETEPNTPPTPPDTTAPPTTTTPPVVVDDDGDGSPADEDCDDSDPRLWPGNRDWCDGLDNDCDGTPDPHCYVLTDADTLWDTPFGSFTGYPLDLAAGDFDGDGVDELAIGTILSDRIYVSDGAPALGQVPFVDTLMTEIVGAEIDDCFGCTVDAGDIDGDGVDELLVGAPFVQHTTTVTTGSLYVFDDLGALPVVAGTDLALAEIQGDPDLSGLAVWQAGVVGDFDGDGVNDVMTGVIDEFNPTSRHYLLSGPFSGVHSVLTDTFATVEEGAADASFAYTSAAGDFDNDGIDDIVVTSHSNDAAYLFLGPITGTVDPSQADASFHGAVGDALGTVVTTGDFDGDGNLDLAIGGEDAHGGKGVLYVAHGPFAGQLDLSTGADFTLTAGTFWPRLADYETKITAADVDGDGTDDLLVGAPGHDPGGVLGVIFGPHLDGSFGDFPIDEADIRITGAVDELVGMNVAWADLDGDGRKDLVVGAYLAGQIGVWYGPTLFP